MSISVKHVEGVRFDITCRSHRITVDQPESEDGTDQGMTPVELLNASLASCAAYYTVLFLQRRFPTLGELSVHAEWQIAEDPHRIGTIHLTIDTPHQLTAAALRGLLRSVEHCTVGNTLKHAPTVRLTVANQS